MVDPPFSLRLSNALVSYAKYLLLTGWPTGLGVYYPFSPEGVPAWQVAGAVVLLLVITAIAIREAWKRPYLIMGWLWFLGTLVPVIGLMRIGIGLAWADRYHYVPSIGLFAAIVFGLARSCDRVAHWARHHRRILRDCASELGLSEWDSGPLLA